MEPFDELAREVATPRIARRAVRSAIVAAVGGLFKRRSGVADSLPGTDVCCAVGGTCAASTCCSPAGVHLDTCGCPPGHTCLNASCCPDARLCGDRCGCPSGSACIDGACCPASRICGASCCPPRSTCVSGACCPEGARICSGGPYGRDTCCSGGACLPGTDPSKGETCCPAPGVACYSLPLEGNSSLATCCPPGSQCAPLDAHSPCCPAGRIICMGACCPPGSTTCTIFGCA